MHIIEVTDKGMNADQRCDRCGAQAYVEAVLPSDGVLLFCAHHARDNVPALPQGTMVADHRPFLKKMEATMAKETAVLNG